MHVFMYPFADEDTIEYLLNWGEGKICVHFIWISRTNVTNTQKDISFFNFVEICIMHKTILHSEYQTLEYKTLFNPFILKIVPYSLTTCKCQLKLYVFVNF